MTDTKDNSQTRSTPSGLKPRGFATLSPERLAELASLGGKKAWETGRAHRFTSEQARAAGKKGGDAYAAKVAAAKKNTEA